MLSPSVLKFNAIIGLSSKIAGDLHGVSGRNVLFDRCFVLVGESAELGVWKLEGDSTELVEVLPKS
jgi:hypothetical protein